jgi:hypothetical protein
MCSSPEVLHFQPAVSAACCWRQLHDLFDNVGDEAPPPPGSDVSAEQWLRSKGVSELQMEVADACYANDFGCSVQQLGLREMITENNK